MRHLGEFHYTGSHSIGWTDVIPAASNAGKGIVLQWVTWRHASTGSNASRVRITDGLTDHREIVVGNFEHHEPINLPMQIPPGYAVQFNPDAANAITFECGWDDLP